ncbi:MAG: glycine zipper domain-containing protein [Pseudorhodoplanes sp.]
MRFHALTAILTILFAAISVVDADAQSRTRGSALAGGLTGAAIGGATGGGRGAAIGSAVGLGVGSMIGGQMERRRGNHYWYNNRCWQRFPNGEFHPVNNRYCR